MLYFLVFCFYGSEMLGEMRESALSLTLGEVSMGEKPECTKEGQLEPKGRRAVGRERRVGVWRPRGDAGLWSAAL